MLHTGVTSITFPSDHPAFLTVACYDGSIHIFDISKSAKTPILSSAYVLIHGVRYRVEMWYMYVCVCACRDVPLAMRHTKPVWQMQWVKLTNNTTVVKHGQV